jgi:hypothetical protein
VTPTPRHVHVARREGMKDCAFIYSSGSLAYQLCDNVIVYRLLVARLHHSLLYFTFYHVTCSHSRVNFLFANVLFLICCVPTTIMGPNIEIAKVAKSNPFSVPGVRQVNCGGGGGGSGWSFYFSTFRCQDGFWREVSCSR